MLVWCSSGWRGLCCDNLELQWFPGLTVKLSLNELYPLSQGSWRVGDSLTSLEQLDQGRDRAAVSFARVKSFGDGLVRVPARDLTTSPQRLEWFERY